MNERIDPQTAKIGVLESTSPRNPSPFSQLPDPSKDSRKLSDLFNVQPSTSEGQSFFDTLNPGPGQTTEGSQEPESQLVETGESERSDFLSHEILQDISTYQDQPLIPDQFANKNIPSEPPHKSLEDIVEAQTQPGLLVGDPSVTQTYQFVQQPFPTPLITQLHLQDASTPQEPFQPTSIPVTPTHQQTMKFHPEPLNVTQHSHVEKRRSIPETEHSKEENNIHSSVPTSPDVELDTKQSEVDKLTSVWIPTVQTSQLLTAVSSGLTNKEQIDQHFLTSPEIVIDEPQVRNGRYLL